MSAERLREAAGLIRQYAEKAAPPPWASGLMGVWSEAEEGERAGEYIASSVHSHNPCKENILNGHDRMHIASWHPAVALGVADWLDNAAEDLDMQGPDGDLRKHWDMRVHINADKALAVADAYLGSA